MIKINIGRASSGGVFNGLFGNPVKEATVSKQYRIHFKKLLQEYPNEIRWLRAQLAKKRVLFCPGCGIGCPTCHARIIEELL